MKKIICLLFCLALIGAMLVACDSGEGDATEAHKHTYSAEWSYDDNGHWYAATCEHTTIKANYAVHADSDKDGKCDVCPWSEDCEHTYAEEWSNDETNHWHAASCGHVIRGDEAPHADGNNDGACDSCSYDYGHTHEFESEWKYDENKHWYAPTCSHDVKKSEGDHVDADNNGVCDTCGRSDGCEHPFKAEWSYDEMNHWHDTECGHSLTDSLGKHADANGDFECDTCAYTYGHTHTWSEDWTSDGDKHWHDSTCAEHQTPARKDAADHVDADNDKICDICEHDEGHVHTYDESKWAYDEMQHWHAGICHTSAKKDAEDHADTDNDGLCNVCGQHAHTDSGWSHDKVYHFKFCAGCSKEFAKGAHIDSNNDSVCDVCLWDYDHNHTYGTDWTTDASYHWHAAICGCTIEPKDKNLHTDINNDGLCDTCGLALEGACAEHTFDNTKWAQSAQGHWRPSLCGHNVKSGFEAHYDDDYNGACDTCGFNVESVVTNATSSSAASKVSKGEIKYTSGSASDIYEYSFGSTTYLCIVNKTTGAKYHYAVSGTTAYALIEENGEIKKNPDEFSMAGYKFNAYDLTGSLGIENKDGVEAFVNSLYFYGADSANGDVLVSYDSASGAYNVRYNILSENLTVIDLTFKVSANNVITYASVSSTIYIDRGDIYSDASFTVIDGVAYLLDGAVAEKTVKYEITQTEGERNATNPYTLITDYTLTDAEGNKVSSGATFEMDARTSIVLNVTDVAPSIALLDTIDPFIFTVDYENGVWASYADGKITITCNKPGSHVITFKTSDTSTFTIKAEVAKFAPSIFGPYVTYPDGSRGEYSQVSGFIGETFTISAKVDKNADASFRASLKKGPDGYSGSALREIYTLKKSGDSYTFTATVAGTYVITMTSSADSAKTCTVTVVLKEKVILTPAEALNGFYQSYSSGTHSINYDALFVPASEGATNGTVTVNYYSENMQGVAIVYNIKYNYTYYVDGIELEFISGTLTKGEEISALTATDYPIAITMDEEGNLKIGKTTATFNLIKDFIDPEKVFSGVYDVYDGETLKYRLTFVPSTVSSGIGILTVKNMVSGTAEDYRYDFGIGSISLSIESYTDNGYSADPVYTLDIVIMDESYTLEFYDGEKSLPMTKNDSAAGGDGGNGGEEEGGELIADISGIYYYTDGDSINHALTLNADGSATLAPANSTHYNATLTYTLTDLGNGAYAIAFTVVEGSSFGDYSAVLDLTQSASYADGSVTVGNIVFSK